MANELEAKIREEVGKVVDPEIGKTLAELDMVREVSVSDGSVKVVIALTTMGCPLANSFQSDVEKIVKELVGDSTAVQVEFTEMTEVEKQRLAERLQAERGDQQKSKQSPGIAEKLNDVKHVVAVLSGKGGVGKSLVTSLLAVALRRKGYTVGVMDADVTGSSIPRVFGISERPQSGFGAIIPPRSRTGIYIMGLNLLLESEDQPVVWRGPLVSGAIQQFWKDVLWGELDYLLIDMPPGTSDAALTVLQQLPTDGVVLVTTPQDLAAMIVRKAVHMADMLKKPVLGVVENMSYFKCPNCGAEYELFGPSQANKVAEIADAPILARLPIDPELPKLCDVGRIEDYKAPVFEEMVDKFVELVEEKGRKITVMI